MVSLLIVSACSTKPHVLEQTEIEFQEHQKIHVVRQGLHTGFVLPASTIVSHLPDVYQSFAGSPYIEFGWGDMDYYQSEEVTSGMTAKAILWPTHAVVRAVAIPDRPDIHFADNELEILCLDQKQYSLLIAFITQSFLRDRDGRITKTMESADGNSEFYQAEGRYYLWNTCNTWTAKGLKSAGWSISPAFKVTPGSVMNNLEKHNEAPSVQRCGTLVATTGD